MDPNEALRALREALGRMAEARTSYEVSEHAVEAAEAAEALDSWLSRGGFLPAAWGEAQAL